VGELKGVLSVPLVPVGCIGAGEEALNPGKYCINEAAGNLGDFLDSGSRKNGAEARTQ